MEGRPVILLLSSKTCRLPLRPNPTAYESNTERRVDGMAGVGEITAASAFLQGRQSLFLHRNSFKGRSDVLLGTLHRRNAAVTFGSNGDRKLAAAFYASGFEPWDVTRSGLLHGAISLDKLHGVVFVMGFSYADVLDSVEVHWVFRQPMMREKHIDLMFAAICCPDGRHLAMMPHSKRCFLMWQFPWYPKSGMWTRKGLVHGCG
ncbi:hypothetical protein DVH24_009418 [Malus domestica]|uniref:Uncharacterized protein n=1 Tax=Malus domestica TaxID=3750 RepID=A0A498ITZ5_MALDO|nr:hypothetical protein DVH24_009418 [Malus domestica]